MVARPAGSKLQQQDEVVGVLRESILLTAYFFVEKRRVRNLTRNPDLVSLLAMSESRRTSPTVRDSKRLYFLRGQSESSDDGLASGEHVGVETIFILEDELPFTRVLADALEDERVLTNSALKRRPCP